MSIVKKSDQKKFQKMLIEQRDRLVVNAKRALTGDIHLDPDDFSAGARSLARRRGRSAALDLLAQRLDLAPKLCDLGLQGLDLRALLREAVAACAGLATPGIRRRRAALALLQLVDVAPE